MKKITEIVESNLSNEHFGVSQLAKELNVSRYTLHRKIITATKLSTTQFIRQIRLKKAKQLLRQTSLNVSEVAYGVGFNSPIYFSKCFHDYFGYPPGKVGEREDDENKFEVTAKSNNSQTLRIVLILSALVVLIVVLFIVFKPNIFKQSNLEKSIVVLPPIYMGSDSSYVHLLDGTVSMVLDNLSLISGMEKVIPWTSVQQYRNSNKSAREIAEELQVSYIVESNGMALEEIIRLNIKIIDGKKGNQVWSKPYEVGTKEFINLPPTIAQNIASEINAEITKDEQVRIETLPTENDSAYYYYLKGIDLYNKGMREYHSSGDMIYKGYNNISGSTLFEEAIDNLKLSVKLDNNFALSYAYLTIIYDMLDKGSTDGTYKQEINKYADKAIINNSQNDICLLAKAYDYINRGENKLAIPFLEKAIEYNPKSISTYRLLGNLYNISREANTEKYLEYKLKAIKLNNIETDSIQKSEDYRLAARSLRVAGFYDDAMKFIETSIKFNPKNISSICEKAEIYLEKNHNYLEARRILMSAYEIDSTNPESLRFLFTNHYLSKDFQKAYNIYKRILKTDPSLSYWAAIDYSRLAKLFDKLNLPEQSELSFNLFKEKGRFEINPYVGAIEKARLYCLQKNTKEALEQLNIFSSQEYHFRYSIRILKDDPVFEIIRDLPEFQQILSEIESKFLENHKRIRANLEEKGLL